MPTLMRVQIQGFAPIRDPENNTPGQAENSAKEPTANAHKLLISTSQAELIARLEPPRSKLGLHNRSLNHPFGSAARKDLPRKHAPYLKHHTTPIKESRVHRTSHAEGMNAATWRNNKQIAIEFLIEQAEQAPARTASDAKAP